MQYDPHLRKTIKSMIKKAKRENVAAFVIAVSPTHSEIRLSFPPWTCITLEGNGIRFRSKKSDFDSDSLQKKITEDSVHVLMQINDLCGMTHKYTDELITQFKKHFDIYHEPFKDFYPADD